MSRVFDGVDDVLTGTPPATAVALTIACWFYPLNDTAVHTLVALDDGSQNNRFALQANGSTAGDPVQASVTAAGSGASASSASGFTANAWNHAVGVFAAAGSRTAYVNAGNSGSNSTSLTPSGINAARVGLNSAGANGTTGRIAEVCIWAAALTAGEAAGLGRGMHPMRVRATAILLYAPLWGSTSPEPDYSRGQHPLTVSGATVGPGAPVQPFGLGADLVSGGAAAAGPTTVRLYTGSEWVDREIKVFDGAVWG